MVLYYKILVTFFLILDFSYCKCKIIPMHKKKVNKYINKKKKKSHENAIYFNSNVIINLKIANMSMYNGK